jgi:hypothetical protein
VEISATVKNSLGLHEAVIRTDANARPLAIPPKPAGNGSAVNVRQTGAVAEVHNTVRAGVPVELAPR